MGRWAPAKCKGIDKRSAELHPCLGIYTLRRLCCWAKCGRGGSSHSWLSYCERLVVNVFLAALTQYTWTTHNTEIFDNNHSGHLSPGESNPNERLLSNICFMYFAIVAIIFDYCPFVIGILDLQVMQFKRYLLLEHIYIHSLPENHQPTWPMMIAEGH